jgi:hypothetical protein
VSVLEAIEAEMSDPAERRLRCADAEYVLRWVQQSETVPPVLHDVAARALNHPSLAHGFAPSSWPISRDGVLIVPGMKVFPPQLRECREVQVVMTSDDWELFPGGFVVEGRDFSCGCAEVWVMDPPATESAPSGIVYLATPYTHDDPAVRAGRFRVVNRVAAQMMARGEHVFSPISHTHEMSIQHGLPHDWNYWAENCRVMVSACSRMVVVKQHGWQESVGVRAEIELAESLGMPVEYVEP